MTLSFFLLGPTNIILMLRPLDADQNRINACYCRLMSINIVFMFLVAPNADQHHIHVLNCPLMLINIILVRLIAPYMKPINKTLRGPNAECAHSYAGPGLCAWMSSTKPGAQCSVRKFSENILAVLWC